jgi:hypothetical protein
MPVKPRYGEKALTSAERSQMSRTRRNRITAELIMAMLNELPDEAKLTYERDPVYGPIIIKARVTAASKED